YYLRDNPFPSTPILDPSSDNDRINGTIYNPNIMAEEIQSFRNKIGRRPPLIYIENSVFERGVGKSALVVQQWRQLQKHSGVTSIYVRSEQKLKPADFAARLISRWHQDGYLWSAVLHALAAYVKENPRGEITPAGAEVFAETFPQLPLRTISLLNFTVFNPDQLITDLATWAYRQIGDGLHLELAHVFFQSYLTDPRTFLGAYPGVLRKHKWDNIAMLAAVYRLLKLGGYEYNYLFFDQFEDVVHGLSGKSLITFNTEMRRLIEASIGQATLIITLHPGATNTLSSNEGGDITSIAPLDPRHVVDMRNLTKEGTSQLAKTYLDHFRLAESPPPHSLYPFTTEAIEEIYNSSAKGNIRACLQALNYAIEKGIDAGSPIIDKDFLAKYHSDITGRVHPDEVVL
ncbi:MAG: hypothetical protein ACREBU_20920, partial [Nitrososphaera sp.]